MEKLKDEFIKYFGEEKWNQEDVLTKLNEIITYLKPNWFPFEIPVILFADFKMDEAARYEPKEDIILLNESHQDDLLELLDSVCHELEHKYQILYAYAYDTPKALRWRNGLENYHTDENPVENVLQELELDAYAFSQVLIYTEFEITVKEENEYFQALIDDYKYSGKLQEE